MSIYTHTQLCISPPQALKDPFADALGGIPPGIFGFVDKERIEYCIISYYVFTQCIIVYCIIAYNRCWYSIMDIVLHYIISCYIILYYIILYYIILYPATRRPTPVRNGSKLPGSGSMLSDFVFFLKSGRGPICARPVFICCRPVRSRYTSVRRVTLSEDHHSVRARPACCGSRELRLAALRSWRDICFRYA